MREDEVSFKRAGFTMLSDLVSELKKMRTNFRRYDEIVDCADKTESYVYFLEREVKKKDRERLEMIEKIRTLESQTQEIKRLDINLVPVFTAMIEAKKILCSLLYTRDIHFIKSCESNIRAVYFKLCSTIQEYINNDDLRSSEQKFELNEDIDLEKYILDNPYDRSE